MKKTFGILAVAALFCIGATSCEKECTCTTTQDGQVVNTATVKAKKCTDAESTSTAGGMTVTVKCK